mgnify:FL=1
MNNFFEKFEFNEPAESEITEINGMELPKDDFAKIEPMMVQLLFKNKPQSPTFEQLKQALEKYLGDLGEVPFFESSDESSSDMFMFPLFNYMVGVDESSNGMPVVATFLGSNTQTGIDVDEIKRHQFWNVKNGNEIVDECEYTILVNTMLGTTLDYKDQATILLAQVGAALDCYPDCIGIYVHQSGKLITPEIFEANKDHSLSERFIDLFVNARFFNISDSDEMLVDTLGFYVFGGADVQVHFKNMNPNHLVSYVYNIASYQFDNDFPIDSGETIDSLDENGNIQMKPQWNVQYEESMVEPHRVVLDINCGEYAGGNRD